MKRPFSVAEKCSGSRAASSRAEAGEPMQTGKDGHERTRKDVKTNPHPEEGRVPDSNARGRRKKVVERVQKADGGM